MVLRPAPARAGALMLAAASFAVAAAAAPAPDSLGLTRLQRACDAAPRVRITTSRRVWESERLTLEPGAVVIPPAPGRRALIQVGEVRESGRRIPWSEIQRLESERSRTLRTTALAALLGAALGGGWLAANGPDLFEKGDNGGVGLAVVLVAGTAATGMLVGMTHPELHPLYP